MNIQHQYPQFYAQQEYVTPRVYNRGEQLFNEDLETFLQNSNLIAQQLLRPEQQENYQRHSRRIGRVGCNSFTFTPIIIGSPTYNVSQRYDRRRRGDDTPSNGLRLFAGIVGAILGGYAFFKIGQAISTNREAGKEVDDVQDFKCKIEAWKADWRVITRDRLGPNQILTKVEKIADCRKNIFNRIRRKSQTDIALLIAFIASAVFAVAGAIVGSYLMLAISLGIGLGAGASLLLKWGLDSVAKGHTEDAKEIEKNVRELWAIRERQAIFAL